MAYSLQNGRLVSTEPVCVVGWVPRRTAMQKKIIKIIIRYKSKSEGILDKPLTLMTFLLVERLTTKVTK